MRLKDLLAERKRPAQDTTENEPTTAVTRPTSEDMAQAITPLSLCPTGEFYALFEDCTDF